MSPHWRYLPSCDTLTGGANRDTGNRRTSPVSGSKTLDAMQKGEYVGIFIPVPQTASFSLLFNQQDGQPAENVFNVKLGTTPTAENMTAVASAIMGWWNDGNGIHSYKGIQSSFTSMVGVYGRALDVEHGPSISVPSPFDPTVGTKGDSQLQDGVTFAITHRTGLAGRSFRGRTYLVGMDRSNLVNPADNQVEPATIGNWIGAFTALIGAITDVDAGYHLVVVSRYADKAPRTTGVTTPVISFGYHDINLDYQRRRAPGHNRGHHHV